MTNVSIVIAFLTILAQVCYGHYGSRYGVRPQTMSRVGTFPRPPLRSPSSLSSSAKSADLLEPGVLPSRQSDTVSSMNFPLSRQMNGVFSSDADAFLRRANEIESEMKKMMFGDPFQNNLPASGGRTAQPIRKMYSFSSSDSDAEQKRKLEEVARDAKEIFDRGFNGSPKSSSRRPLPINEPPSESNSAQPLTKKESFSTPGINSDSSGPMLDPPVKKPEPPARTPSSNWPNFAFRFNAPKTQSATPIPPPPPSCSAGDQKPSIDQYRSKGAMSKRPSFKGDDYETPKAAEPPAPPKHKTSPATSGRNGAGGRGSSPPRNSSGSFDNQRYKGSTIVSENLPNNSGTIDIHISGTQIDDERISQMIKEARNAITVVFYGPVYDTAEVGELIITDRPPSTFY